MSLAALSLLWTELAQGAEEMSPRVFINYRRNDSAGHAGRIHDRLEREFGRQTLFMDVDNIPLGLNFTQIVREQVSKCNVLLALIGPGWLNARDEQGERRLSNPNDYVRLEIAMALQRDIPVIPILLDGAKLPSAEELPEDIRELALRNGLDVRHTSFGADTDKLIARIKSGPHTSFSTRVAKELSIAVAAVTGGAIATFVFVAIASFAYDAFISRFLGLPNNVDEGHLVILLIGMILTAAFVVYRRNVLLDMHPVAMYAILAAPPFSALLLDLLVLQQLYYNGFLTIVVFVICILGLFGGVISVAFLRIMREQA